MLIFNCVGDLGKLHSTIALSTNEAEYMAMIEAIKEAVWTPGFEDLGFIRSPILKLNITRRSLSDFDNFYVYVSSAKEMAAVLCNNWRVEKLLFVLGEALNFVFVREF